MALTNKERVGRVLDAARAGAAPFVIREYKMTYKSDWTLQVERALTTPAFSLPDGATDSVQNLEAALDTHSVLNLMLRNWFDVFHDKLGHTGRSYTSELLSARNDWAHGKAFSNDEAYRVADTARRLLEMVSAPEQTRIVGEIASELLRLRFDREAEQAKKVAETTKTEQTTTLAGLKPWRDVIQPHPDVASGRYVQAEFAADLAQVVAGTAAEEYQNPVEFFRRTYLTEGLEEMLVSGIRRLTAQGGDPVVQLKTAFGGGKTHSMLALYHLCSGDLTLNDIPGGERLAARIGQVDLPEANRAVIVGTALDPSKPRDYGSVTARTLWGELACQLGGQQVAEAYAIVAEADRKGVSPNSNTLVELLDRFGPCLIMVDEFVAYARNIYGVDDLPAGSFASLMTFIQALTEAVRRSTDSMLLVSLPESAIEMGGPVGEKVLEIVGHAVGRMESVWKPVSPNESFEIVRRRLFSDNVDYAARDAVVDAFAAMYRNASGEFPAGVAESDYRQRMKAAYPIHPELFDRLYQDWSTLDRFQRTRGVLRLMAAVIHQLWEGGDQALLILPGTVPLAAIPVRNELLRYLPDTWAAVFDKDVDGAGSIPLQTDRDVPMLGRYAAARRVARTVFLGSAPSVAAQHVRGLEEVRIRLGSAQPGEATAVFGDALRRLENSLTYLYTDGTRYWYDTRPTVNKLARDLAQEFRADQVNQEIIARLRQVPKRGDFAAHHVAPLTTGDVADEDRARVVVLHPDYVQWRSTSPTDAEVEALALLQSRGAGQRHYKNMLLFIAPDREGMDNLRQAVRNYLAWRQIDAEEEAYNLDAQQRKQVRQSLRKDEETVDLRLREAYSWLLVPEQPEPLGKIAIRASKIGGDDNFYERAARRLQQDGLLIKEWSPDILRMELDSYYWREDRGWEVRLSDLWADLAKYCYFPRLLNRDVLRRAVEDGVRRIDAPFAYATGADAEGCHTGLVYRSGGSIYFDERSLLVHPQHVKEATVPETLERVESGAAPVQDGGPIAPPRPAPPRRTTRYYGRVPLDSQRVNREISTIVEEVLQHLTGLVGAEVEVTLEIKARRPEGFDEATIRTVSENSRTLKFEQFGFEKE